MITEKELLHYIGKQPRHLAGFKQIVHDLGIKGKDRRSAEGLLREMTRQRKLVAIGKERWSLPTSASKQDLVAGQLRMHRDGYGFVVPEAESLPARARGKLQGDIFIPPPAIGSAMHGDQVLVEMGPIRQDGRAEGRILRVTERQQETVVGKFHYGSRHNYVTPIDEKWAGEIIMPHGMEDPEGAGKSSPHRVVGDVKRVATAPSPVIPKSQSRAPQPQPGQHRPGPGAPGAVPHEHGKGDDLEGMVVEVEVI